MNTSYLALLQKLENRISSLNKIKGDPGQATERLEEFQKKFDELKDDLENPELAPIFEEIILHLKIEGKLLEFYTQKSNVKIEQLEEAIDEVKKELANNKKSNTRRILVEGIRLVLNALDLINIFT